MSRIVDLLRELDEGEFESKCDRWLAEVVDAVETTGGAGELVIKLKVKFDSHRAVVSPEVKPKVPLEPCRTSLFHFNNGTLSAENPRQAKLFTELPKRNIADPDIDKN